MNWQFIFLQIVVFAGLISIMVAVIYYLRHRHAKAVDMYSEQNQDHSADGGELLKRYVPPEHRREKYNGKKSLFASRPIFYAACMFVPILFLSFIGSNYYINRDDFLEDIMLEAGDIESLSDTRYILDESVGVYADSLATVTSNIARERNIVVVAGQNESDYLPQGWIKIIETVGGRATVCFFETLSECDIDEQTTVVFPLAGAPPNLASVLLKSGVNVLVYGFPNDIANSQWLVPGLTFSESERQPVPNLAVVGDMELTLGLDAGTNLPVGRLRDDVKVSSSRPQAVSLLTDGVAGGDLNTRMYAAAIDNARLVWVDFSATAGDYTEGEDRVLFDSIVAGILRYATGQTYQSIASWPEGRKYAALFEEDTEDGYENAEKVARLFIEEDVPVTFYALSDLANQNRQTTKLLAKAGEIACHGDNHDIMTRYSLQQQVEKLARCQKVLGEITGQKIVGFRPPTEAHNLDTFSAMLNVDMEHVFTENSTSTQVPHFKTDKLTGKSLVSFPRVVTDDYYMWHYLKLNKKRSLERLRNEKEWIKFAGTFFGFSFHSQFMANQDNFDVIKELVQELKHDEDVYINTSATIADWWRVRHALLSNDPVPADKIARFKPMQLRVAEDGLLYRAPITGVLDGAKVQFADQSEE